MQPIARGTRLTRPAPVRKAGDRIHDPGRQRLVCHGWTHRPFDLEVFYGERIAVLGANGTGKSHFLRLLAHDRWFARSFDRFVTFGEDDRVIEISEPDWA